MVVLSIMHRLLRRLGCTSVGVSETPWGVDSLGSGVEEFVVDGIIKLEPLKLLKLGFFSGECLQDT